MKTKIEIKSIFGDLIFELKKENNTIKYTLLEAIKNGAYLRSADLYGADLYGANLCGANLRGANLCSAYLRSANLYGADLYGAYLYGANLCGANLYGANLRDANLCSANLYSANLYGANLYGANLYGANLRGVNLYGANLYGANLYDADNVIAGKVEDWMSHDNIGSRKSRTLFFKTCKGVFVQCGCFFGDLEKFVEKVKETHQGNKHERDYLALVEFIKIRFEL